MKINDYEILPITEVSLDKKIMILEWRNHDNIRKWMYGSEIISEASHLQFIDKLKNDTKNEYFLVQKDNVDIGVIYFNKIDFIDKSTYFGLYANPFIKLAGVGKILEEICINYVFEVLKFHKLKLEVLSNNERALNLYKKYNFKEFAKKVINDKDVICMELENRSWVI